MVKGGDKYTMIPDNLIEHKNTGFLDNDLLVAYIRANKPLKEPSAGRITVLDHGSDVSHAADTTKLSTMTLLHCLLTLITSYLKR